MNVFTLYALSSPPNQSLLIIFHLSHSLFNFQHPFLLLSHLQRFSWEEKQADLRNRSFFVFFLRNFYVNFLSQLVSLHVSATYFIVIIMYYWIWISCQCLHIFHNPSLLRIKWILYKRPPESIHFLYLDIVLWYAIGTIVLGSHLGG